MVRTIVLAMLAALPAYAQAMLDTAGIPGLDEAGRHAYADFLLTNLPRAFAIGSNHAYGYEGSDGNPGGGRSIEVARAAALNSCAAQGATDCAIYAEDLDVVWHGRPAARTAVPAAFTSDWNHEIVPDDRFFWRGAREAAGVYIWAHGHGDRGRVEDLRGRQVPPYARALNDASFDILRFDRQPNADNQTRAAGWLSDALADLRRRGYRRVVVGGQSRGGWNSLQMLAHAGLVDAVIAVSPAGESNLRAQYDDLRRLLADVPPQRTRLAFVQFTADHDAADLAGRASLVERLRPNLGALLMIDRPASFSGHSAGNTVRFAQRYADCFRRFVLDTTPPETC